MNYLYKLKHMKGFALWEIQETFVAHAVNEYFYANDYTETFFNDVCAFVHSAYLMSKKSISNIVFKLHKEYTENPEEVGVRIARKDLNLLKEIIS